MGRRDLLQHVVQGFSAASSETRERNVTAPDSIRERFEDLFLAHYPRIVAILNRMLGDRARAEDLANETFLKLYRQPLAHQPDGNVPGWLYRTATNLGIDALRSSARRKRYEQAAARAEVKNSSAESALDQALRAEMQQRVRAVLAGMKPVHAQALLLRACGHSYKELADSLGVEGGSVGTLLIRAEAAFEKSFRELYGEEEVP